ncbi:hypothetical protein SGFS_073300 [Streptomyces graminofaciens]|uniref:Uncharacterized protein n=1 Tax=Streptomyces graminofaciens TaxID=68212 RepID=A0ABM7FG47_9ACTN|nr:hypothetical protein SGFS_073300 [Streptomyces graminofaciens]
MIHSSITSTANAPSPSPAASAPPSNPATSPDDRRPRENLADNGGTTEAEALEMYEGREKPEAVEAFEPSESVACVTLAMLPTTRSFPAQRRKCARVAQDVLMCLSVRGAVTRGAIR